MVFTSKATDFRSEISALLIRFVDSARYLKLHEPPFSIFSMFRCCRWRHATRRSVQWTASPQIGLTGQSASRFVLAPRQGLAVFQIQNLVLHLELSTSQKSWFFLLCRSRSIMVDSAFGGAACGALTQSQVVRVMGALCNSGACFNSIDLHIS